MQEKEHAEDVIEKQIYYPMVFVQDVIMHYMEKNTKEWCEKMKKKINEGQLIYDEQSILREKFYRLYRNNPDRARQLENEMIKEDGLQFKEFALGDTSTCDSIIPDMVGAIVTKYALLVLESYTTPAKVNGVK